MSSGQGNDNNGAKGSSIKTKSAKYKEQAQSKKACEAAAASVASTATLTHSSFVGDDPDYPALDWTANITMFYCKFKREMAHHAGKNESLMSTVIKKGANADTISEVRARFGTTPPSAIRNFTKNDADNLNAKEKLCYNADLWEYRSRFQVQIKGETTLKVECCKF